MSNWSFGEGNPWLPEYLPLTVVERTLAAIKLERLYAYYEFVYFQDPDDPKRTACVWHDEGQVKMDDLEMSLGYTNIDMNAFISELPEEYLSE